MNVDNFAWDALQNNLDPKLMSKPSFEPDTRFWKLSKDENGNGQALIRLLPDKNGVPYIRQYHYSLKAPNPGGVGKKAFKWYIKTSPESIGLPDPVKEHYGRLMEEGTQETAKEAERFRRQTEYITNILVIKDPKNPENNGKIFLWKFGNMLKDKFMGWIQPSEDAKALGENPKELYNPLAKGSDILLKLKPKGDFGTYEDTQVREPAAAFQSKDEAIEVISNKTFALSDFQKPEAFEPYEKLKADFEKFIGKQLIPDYNSVRNTAKAEPVVTQTKPNVEQQSNLMETKTVVAPVIPDDNDDDGWLSEIGD